VLHDGKLVTMWYMSGQPYWVDPVSLETIGPADLKTGQTQRISAHSKTDEANGDFVFFDYSRTFPYMHQGVLNAAGELTSFTPIELPGPRMPHDMWISHKHTILHNLPLIWDEAA
jgi:carotenoid cleavage dioxygenase-like enzyme